MQLPDQRRRSHTLLRAPQWNNKEQIQVGIQKIPIKYKDLLLLLLYFFYHKSGQSLAQVIQTGCGISTLADTQDLTGRGPEQLDFIIYALSKGLG